MMINSRAQAIPMEDEGTIPSKKSHLMKLNEISKITKEAMKGHPLFDIIGNVYRVESKSPTRISLKIIDDSCTFIRVTIWGEHAKRYLIESGNANSENHVLHISCVKLDFFRDELGISTTDYSTI